MPFVGHWYHWNSRVFMMPTLSSLMAPELVVNHWEPRVTIMLTLMPLVAPGVVVTTTSGATSGNKFDIITTSHFQLWCECHLRTLASVIMMTSSKRKHFPRYRPFVRGRIHMSQVNSLNKASDTELWCFHWSAPEQTVEQTIGDLRRHGAHYSTVL